MVSFEYLAGPEIKREFASLK